MSFSRRRQLGVFTLCLLVVFGTAVAESRFGRKVLKIEDPKQYQFLKLDDVSYAFLTGEQVGVACLTYRGSRYYYVEVAVINNLDKDLPLAADFVSFVKPGYSVFRKNSIQTATEIAQAAGGTFVPVPPPTVPPTTTTTFSGYANRSGSISGTGVTTTDTSGQAWANAGNAIGNAFAQASFYRNQRRDLKLAGFLYHLAQEWHAPLIVKARQPAIVACVFEQTKGKKMPFQVIVRVMGETFTFKYKE